MASTVPPTRAVAFAFEVPVLDTSGKFKTGAAFSASQISKDGGAFNALTNAPAEIGSSGMYTLSLTAGEMTCDRFGIRLVVSTASCQDVPVIGFTTARRIDDLSFPATAGRSMVVDAAGLVDANAVKLGPTGAGTAQTAADVGGIVVDTVADLDEIIAATTAASIAGSVWNAAAALYLDSGTLGLYLTTILGYNPGTIWAYATRTLTQGAASVAATVQAGKITAYAGTTWSLTLTGLTDFTGWTKLYFTVKTDRTKADTTALIQILLTNPGDGTNDGLRIVNGAPYGTHADGSIVVNSTTSITVTVKPAANSALAAAGADYDVKAVISSVVNEISDGSGLKFTIINPTTLTYS